MCLIRVGMDRKRWMVFSLVLLLGVGVSVYFLPTGEVAAAPEDREQRLVDLRQRLELSKLKLLRTLDRENAGLEERRLAMAEWYQDNEELIERERKLTRAQMDARPLVAMPDQIPSKSGLSDEEFVEKANQYLSQAHLAKRGRLQKAEDVNEARQKIAAWKERPRIKRLIAERDEALARIEEAARSQVVELIPEEELAAMAPVDRAESELVNMMAQAFKESPLEEGAEGRDRLHAIRHELAAKRAEVRRLRRQEGRQLRNQRIAELEAQVGNSN